MRTSAGWLAAAALGLAAASRSAARPSPTRRVGRSPCLDDAGASAGRRISTAASANERLTVPA